MKALAMAKNMKRVFITGISGFAGSHLAEMLAEKGGYEVYGTVFGDGYRAKGVPADNFFQLNLLDRERTMEVVEKVQPELVFHLAALSSPAESFKDPRKTLTNNIEGQINVLDALLNTKVEKVLIVGSAEEYGPVKKDNLPINETQELRPLSPYAVSKVAQDYLGLQYFLHHKLPIVRVRPFNHTGSRQAPMFVIPAFAKQIAEIEAGLKEPVVMVGNLEAVRDFTDVKDMMAAYLICVEQGELGEVYNLGSGTGRKIEEVLNTLIEMAKVPIQVKTDPTRLQASDVPYLEADYTKFNKMTGWRPKIAFNTTLRQVLDYWRSQV